MKRTILTAIVSVLIIVTLAFMRHIRSLDNQIQFKKIELKDNSLRLKLLDEKYTDLNKQLDKTGADKVQVEQQLKAVQEERDQLQADLQAKANAKASSLAKATLGAVGHTASAEAPQTDNWYMWYIFNHEGGIASVNALGCKGLGQDCNGGLPSACPNWQVDEACQIAFFTNYMSHRYGTWANAYAFKVANGWW